MVIVAFKPGEKEISKYEELDQYDYGQILRIQGLNLPPAVEIHFALQKTGGTSKKRIGITKDGVTDVPIPDSMLENEDETKDYDIYAFIYITDETSGQTEYRITLKVKARPKPEAFDRPEDAEIFKEAIKAVNESAARSAESEKQAEGWAHGREDLPERTQDNAKYYSDQAREDSVKTDADRKEVGRLVESVSGIGEQVEKVESLTKQAQTSATNAALSEQAAKESENNAAQARAGAEVAEDNAELAAQKVEQDKAIVEQAKNIVKQMGQEVLDNKNLVDEMAQDFDLKAQQALADVNNAGQAQTERVQTAGNDAVESVRAAQGTATRAVETAKTEAIEAVQTEGATQAGNVSAEGEKQVQAVRGAAQEIIADREQIQMNKEGVAKLKEDLTGLHSSLYAEKSDLKEITNRYNMINPDNVVRGTVNMSGVIIESEYSAYDVIKYISVEAGKTYGMSYKGSAGGRLPLEPDRTVFYNERKEFVEQSTSEGECTNFITKNRPYSKNVYGITAKNNGYLCLQVSHGLQEIMFYSDLSDEYIGVFMQSSNAKIKEAAIHEANLDDDLKMRFKSVNDVNGIMSEVVDSKEIPYNLLNPSKSIKGTLGITGTTSEDLTSPHLVSDYIFLKAGIRYNLSYFNKNYNDRYNLYAGRYCFYDSQTKVFKDQSTDLKESPIPYIEYSVKFGGGGYTLIKPSANVFMKIQYSNDLEKAQIIEGADPTYVESYEPTKKYALRNKIVELNNLSDELRAKIETGATKVTDDIYKLAFCKIHKNVLCIGDSLTEGYHNPDDIRVNMSYPSHMESLAGYNVTNKGQSGITALGWWNAYKDKVDFTEFDAVFIYLGTNGGLTDTIDADTISGNFETFAQTNTGGYCAIIAKIKSVNPKCKIYMIQYNNITATSQVTAKIAKKYDCVTLLVTDNSVFNLTDSKFHTDSTHYNSIGYWAFACVMLIQLEKYIAGHISEYTDLVGIGEIYRP